MSTLRCNVLPGLTGLVLTLATLSFLPVIAQADVPAVERFDMATATGNAQGSGGIPFGGISVDAYSGPAGESPGGSVSFITTVEMKGQQLPVVVAGPVTCLNVSGNTAVIKFDGRGDFDLGTVTVTLTDNGGGGLDRFDAALSSEPGDCSTGFALSGGPLDGRAVVLDDTDYTSFETRIDSGPSGPTNDSTPTFAFSSSPRASGFECKLDSEPFRACSGPGNSDSLPVLADGSHTFTVRALDSASNADPTPASRTFTVDTVPPDTAIDSGPTGFTNDASASFGFSSNAPGRFLCRFDAGYWNPCESPAVWTDYSELLDGPHIFAVQAIDAASNADPTPATRAFTFDSEAPVTTITKGPKRRVKTKRKRVKLRVSFISDARASFECRLDKAAYEPCASPYEVKAKSRPHPGKEHTISVRATDPAGNVGESAAVKFTIIRKAR